MSRLFEEMVNSLARLGDIKKSSGALAFDIDGVFTPDLIIEDYNKPEVPISTRQYQKPLFTIPNGIEWYAITGRPIQDREQTFSWFEEHFKNPPAKIFMNEGEWDSPLAAKITALEKLVEVYGGVLFFESDREQQIVYNKMIGIQCVHFETAIRGMIRHYITRLM